MPATKRPASRKSGTQKDAGNNGAKGAADVNPETARKKGQPTRRAATSTEPERRVIEPAKVKKSVARQPKVVTARVRESFEEATSRVGAAADTAAAASHQVVNSGGATPSQASFEVFRDSRPPLPSSHSRRMDSSLEPWSSQFVKRSGASLTERDMGLDREAVRQSVASHVEYTQGKDEFSATAYDYYCATARAVRDRLFDRWNKTQQGYYRNGARRVYYLSLEYLLGRSLEDALTNLGIQTAMQDALTDLGLELSAVAQAEPDAGLGNGGLGRLAACLLDSMATVGIAATGYGIRYEYGIFEQQIRGGRQIERADNWLRYGSPWEVLRPETRYLVRFGGRVEVKSDGSGRPVFQWCDTDQVWAVACDYLIPGYGNDVVNTLRLWSARATKGFAFECFNSGDYIGAVEDKNRSENLSRVLYPNDDTEQGRELRLRQEYFFVAATLQDAIARHMKTNSSLATLPEQAVFHLNDTHPGIAVAELMRLLVDEYGFGWEEAWATTTRGFAYTNHTVLPEALESWPVALLERILPRHLQIIYEINRRFLDEVSQRFPNDAARVARMSLFAELPEKRLRMAHLCVVGSFAVNGVSELHGRILRDTLFRDFAEFWPQKFTHITNGITVRRWLLKSNASLSTLITAEIGNKWVTDARQLRRLAPLSTDAEFRKAWRKVKRENKERLAAALRDVHGIALDPSSLLDVHVKRIHEYKRQLMNILHVVALYLNYRAYGPPKNATKRTFLFAGKAAPGYLRAKEIIELIVAVGATIERDARVRDWLSVVFVPNYGVSLAELIMPAADLSEQISLAGTEASGTGNMKLALNGALTIGTADGSNLELSEAVGLKNIFLFGLTAAEVEGTLRRGYDPRQNYATELELRAVLDAIGRGVFSPEQPGRFAGIVQSLLVEDRFLVLADFVSYRNSHRNVLETWADQEEWTRRSIMNTSNMGQFSSDEVVRNYARDIWRVTA